MYVFENFLKFSKSNTVIYLSGSNLLFYQMANFLLLKIQVRGLRQNKGKNFFYEVRNFYWQFALHNADDEEMKDFSGKGK